MASPTMVFNIKFSVFGFRKNYKSRDDEFTMDPKIGLIIKISICKYIIHPGIQPTDISHEEQKIRSIQLISRETYHVAGIMVLTFNQVVDITLIF